MSLSQIAPSLNLVLFDPDGLVSTPRSPAGGETLDGFFATFELVKLSAKKPGTVQKYRDTLAHWRTAVGDVPIADLRTPTILAFYRHLLAQPGRYGAERMADHSIHYHLVRLAAMLKLAQRKGLCCRVGELPDIPQHAIDDQKKLVKYWVTVEEMELVLASGACDRKRSPRLSFAGHRVRPGDWWRAAIYLTWWTACRISQLLALKWSDLEVTATGEAVLTIRPTVKRAKQHIYKLLDDRSLELLAQLRPAGDWAAWHDRRIFAGLSPQASLAQHFKRLFRWAGVELPPGSAWHSLRRGRCESEFLAGGPAYAQAMLGHRDLATTEASYLSEQIRRAASIEDQRRFRTQSTPSTQ
jgi:integrase